MSSTCRSTAQESNLPYELMRQLKDDKNFSYHSSGVFSPVLFEALFLLSFVKSPGSKLTHIHCKHDYLMIVVENGMSNLDLLVFAEGNQIHFRLHCIDEVESFCYSGLRNMDRVFYYDFNHNDCLREYFEKINDSLSKGANSI